jgi:phage tail sheath gpL-like
MGIPVAIAPSVRTPGAAIKVNLLAGASSPGAGQLKVLLIAPKSSAGTITAQTQLVAGVAGEQDVGTYLGTGTPGHLWAKAAFKEYGLLQVDLVSPDASAGVVASGTLTFASTPTVSQTLALNVAGRFWEQTWTAGQTASSFATQVKNSILARTGDLPVTASDNGAGVTTLTFKMAGTLGNDVIVKATLYGGSGGTVDAGSTVTKNLTSGTSFADPTTVLGLVTTEEYAFIALVDGNASVLLSSNSPYGTVQSHIEAYDEGLSALLQQTVIGFTGTAANAITAAGYRNHGPTCLVSGAAFQSLPCELQGAEIGARVREVSADPAVNRIKMAYKATLYLPLDEVGDKLTDAENEAALQGGVTPVAWGSNGTPYPLRPVTTYHLDTNSNPDDRLVDVSRVDGTYAVARDLRSAVPQQFEGKKILPDLPAGSELPPGVVQEKTVRTFVVNRVGYWVTQGVVRGDAFDDALANGEFICQVDPGDSSQLDIVVPVKIVPPLAKFSIVVNHTGP